MGELGRIVILNGPPRAGKSSIATALQADPTRQWMNIGVDTVMPMRPPHVGPSIGLRPGGERPDLEEHVAATSAWMFDAIASMSRHGLDAAVDTVLHDSYTRPLDLLADAARRLAGLPAVLVAVTCPIDVIADRRDASRAAGERYEGRQPDGAIAPEVHRWQDAVHATPADLAVDTSVVSPDECARRIDALFEHDPPGRALADIADAVGRQAGMGTSSGR